MFQSLMKILKSITATLCFIHSCPTIITLVKDGNGMVRISVCTFM